MIEHPIHKNLLQFETLNKQESLFAFTTTTSGGVSKDNYQSFNLGLFSGDEEANVIENRRRLIEEIGTSELCFPYQTHKDKVALIDENFLSKTEEQKCQLLYGVDALITNQKQICIGIGTADCVPIVIYDPLNHVLAAIHAGWRGTTERITEKVVDIMLSTYGSLPQDLLVGLGPAISQKNFEVGDEVVIALRDAQFDIDRIAEKNKSTQKYHIDLWLSNKIMLQEKGILEENIEISNLCTFDCADKFFSARRQTVFSGRMITGGVLQ